MIFMQLFDRTSGTYSYPPADENTREAVFIDTVYEQCERDLALVRERGEECFHRVRHGKSE